MTKQKWDLLGQGSLFLIGGESNICYDHLIGLLGGAKKARILLLTHASELPDAGRCAAAKFWNRGVPDNHVIWLNRDDELRIDPKINCVFLIGGDQRKIIAFLSEKEKQMLRNFVKAGGLLAGSSAGVPVMSNLMIAGGSPVVSDCSLDYGPGLGILPDIFFDMHFTNRMRSLRVLTALGQFGHFQPYLFGFDEDTGLHISRTGTGTVYGASRVHFYDGRNFFSDLKRLDEEKYLSIDFSRILAGESQMLHKDVIETSLPCRTSVFKTVAGLSYSCLGQGAKIDFSSWKVNVPGNTAT